MDYELKPLGIGEMLDRSLRIYLRHFLLLAGIELLFRMAEGGLGLALLNVIGADGRTAVSNPGLFMGATMGTVVLQHFIGGVRLGAVAVAVFGILRGSTPTLGRCLRGAFSGLFRLGAAGAVWGLLLTAGFAACLIPGVLLLAPLACTIPVAAVEERGPFKSVARSWRLAKGENNRILATTLVAYIAPTVFVGGLNFFAQTQGWSPWLTAPIVALASGLLLPLGAVALVVVYVDLRIRKEAFDLQVLAETLQD